MDFELTEEQKDIKTAAHEFAEKEFTAELAREYDRKEEFPWDLYKKAAKLGLICPHFEEEYGGQGLGLLETCLIIEEFCKVDPTLGVAVTLGSFGSDLIHTFGTDDQKKRYLPRVISGECTSSGALTEPEHGSDIMLLDTVAVREKDEYVINGTKTLITNVPYSDFITVLCQTNPEAKHRGQTLLLVEGETEGLDRNKLEGKMGIRASVVGELSFSDVRVPKENVVGEVDKGFYHSLDFLNVARIDVAAQAVGMAQGALDRAISYAKERKAFGRRLVDLQVTQHKFAEMSTKTDAARLLTYNAAWYFDKKGKADPVITAKAKYFAPEMAKDVIYEALQIFGGYGYFEDYDLERYCRDVRITSIYEGTTEIQKETIAGFMLK